MYKGKHIANKAKLFERSFVLLTSLILVVALGVGFTVAYLIDNTNEIQNTFTPADVPPEVTESFDGYVKKNVKVQNTGNISAYIRALINVTWQDEEGNIAPEVPVYGVDYTMSAPEKGWVEHGGYWYYTQPVAPTHSTSELIPEADWIKENGDYKLVIDIVSQTIQSEGVDEKGNKPIVLAWGVDISGGRVSTATPVK